MEILIAAVIAAVIAIIVLAINGDDGEPWPHGEPGENSEHQWK
jgi:hypothetical protein